MRERQPHLSRPMDVMSHECGAMDYSPMDAGVTAGHAPRLLAMVREPIRPHHCSLENTIHSSLSPLGAAPDTALPPNRLALSVYPRCTAAGV